MSCGVVIVAWWLCCGTFIGRPGQDPAQTRARSGLLVRGIPHCRTEWDIDLQQYLGHPWSHNTSDCRETDISSASVNQLSQPAQPWRKALAKTAEVNCKRGDCGITSMSSNRGAPEVLSGAVGGRTQLNTPRLITILLSVKEDGWLSVRSREAWN